MTTRRQPAAARGYLLIEMMVYISVLAVILGFGYAALYRCLNNSAALRYNAEDITRTLAAGERWRDDVHHARGPLRLENLADGQMLRLPQPEGEISYWFTTNTVCRRVGQGTWTPVLANVKTTAFLADAGSAVTSWRWELELQMRTKTLTWTRPLFTFIAVPATNPRP